MRSLYGVLPPLADLERPIKTDPASRGFLRAYSVKEHRVKWEAQTATAWDGGVLATAGGLVFQGDANGNLNVYGSDTGERLASIPLGTSMMAAPMTYRVNGVQYVAIIAGYGGGAVITGYPLDPASAAYRYGNEGRIIALKVGGPPPPLPHLRTDSPFPDLPPRPTDQKQIAAGEVLYNRYCSRCHVMGRGNLPDLRRIEPGTHALFSTIVLGGAFAAKGMGRFDDVLSPADVDAIHAYLIDGGYRLKAVSPPSAEPPDPHVHAQLVPPAADDHAAERRHVAEIPPPGERHVVFADHAVVGRIEIDPAMRRTVHRYPGVGGIAADQGVRLSVAGGPDISAHVAGGETSGTQTPDHEVREVLADAAAAREHVGDRGAVGGRARNVVEIAVDLPR